MRPLRNLSLPLLAALTLALAGPAGAQAPGDRPRPELGLMGTLPIYWGEAGELGDLVGGNGAAHWARSRLERSYRLRPLDWLDAKSLAGLEFLLLAQPRALSPAENVALDAWVREGGRLLLFADPMLTGRSRFAIGDRRRPQDVILLSPILTHWGLQLLFNVDEPEGVELVDLGKVPVPVNRPGHFVVPAEPGNCAVDASPVLARCAIGEGAAVVVADAAVLDLYDPHPASEAALGWLLEQSFAESGENAGHGSAGRAASR